MLSIKLSRIKIKAELPLQPGAQLKALFKQKLLVNQSLKKRKLVQCEINKTAVKGYYRNRICISTTYEPWGF